jgi:23S rRNA pseudouridine1911/1915/1917 synthase
MNNPDNTPRPGVYRFAVSENSAGLRIDLFLAENSDLFTRGLARRLIDIGGVHLSGRRVRRCSQPVAVGDTIEVFIDNHPPVPMRLDSSRILYRDQELIVIDKPPGMATQPTPARYQGTVYAELQQILKNSGGNRQRPSIGMVQRLDRDTSGVMVFSIHQRAHKEMTDAFRGRSVDKVYWALVAGSLPDAAGKFSSQLARRRSTNLMVSVEHGGKPAETRYRQLQALAEISLVEIQLITGRSHQIRAHFSEAGLPLLGDIAYGGPRVYADREIPRQMLHAKEISFCHPVSGKRLTFNAPLPDDFIAVLNHVNGALNDLGG